MNLQVGALSRFVATIVFALAVTACETIPQGPSSHPPDLSGGIPIYTATEQIPHPFTVVGPVSYYNLGKFQIMSVEDSFADLRQQASAVGANAVLIDSTAVIVSGIVSRGISVQGHAIIESASGQPYAPVQQQKVGLSDRPTVTPSPAPTSDMASRLKELDQLRQKNLITPAEYDEQRKRILNQL